MITILQSENRCLAASDAGRRTMSRMRSVLVCVCCCVLMGCASQPKERYIEVQRRVDPRLLEQSDQPGPAWMEERARLFHSFVEQNEQYPILVYCHMLLHGGYSVRFKSSERSASRKFITYYFDSKGHIMTWEKTIVD